MQDIKKVYGLFMDVSRSTQFLQEFHRELMFSDGTGSSAPDEQAATAAAGGDAVQQMATD